MSRPLRGIVIGALVGGMQGVAAAQERDEPMPAADAAPAAEASIEYGAIDAATVRVFAIGAVGLTNLDVRGRHISVATPMAGHGSGFVTSPGLIVTARHVVDNAYHLVVRLPGEGGFYAARLIYEDEDDDVAVLHIDAAPPVIQLAPDAKLHVRQTVFAIGYPLDPSRTQAQSARGIVAGEKGDTIQLDMALNPGNSGGPLVDESDRVVGMVIARGDPEKGVQGIGFAVRAPRITSAVKQAQRRLDARQIAELTDGQRQSAVVVDELVQKGVFHEIRETADLKAELRSADVQRSLESLIARIEDPDLLVFVGGLMWNVYLALWAADVLDLDRAGITRETANDLANQFGHTSGVACRKARMRDAEVATRSPIVDVVLATWREGDPPPPPGAAPRLSGRDPRATTSKPTPPIADVILRLSEQTAYFPAIDRFGAGFGVGLGFKLLQLGFRIGGARIFPLFGFAIGTVDVSDKEDEELGKQTYYSFEFGLVAEVGRGGRGLVFSVMWAPGVYSVAADGSEDTPAETESTSLHVRVEGGYRWRRFSVGAAAHVIRVPTGYTNYVESISGFTYWMEPIVIAVIF